MRLVRGLDEAHPHHLRAAGEDMAPDRRFSCFHGGAPILLDHVLCSERLHRALTSFEIHNEALRYHGPYVEGGEQVTIDSDHALNVAEFSS